MAGRDETDETIGSNGDSTSDSTKNMGISWGFPRDFIGIS